MWWLSFKEKEADDKGNRMPIDRIYNTDTTTTNTTTNNNALYSQR